MKILHRPRRTTCLLAYTCGSRIRLVTAKRLRLAAISVSRSTTRKVHGKTTWITAIREASKCLLTTWLELCRIADGHESWERTSSEYEQLAEPGLEKRPPWLH